MNKTQTECEEEREHGKRITSRRGTPSSVSSISGSGSGRVPHAALNVSIAPSAAPLTQQDNTVAGRAPHTARGEQVGVSTRLTLNTAVQCLVTRSHTLTSLSSPPLNSSSCLGWNSTRCTTPLRAGRHTRDRGVWVVSDWCRHAARGESQTPCARVQVRALEPGDLCCWEIDIITLEAEAAASMHLALHSQLTYCEQSYSSAACRYRMFVRRSWTAAACGLQAGGLSTAFPTPLLWRRSAPCWRTSGSDCQTSRALPSPPLSPVALEAVRAEAPLQVPHLDGAVRAGGGHKTTCVTGVRGWVRGWGGAPTQLGASQASLSVEPHSTSSLTRRRARAAVHPPATLPTPCLCILGQFPSCAPFFPSPFPGNLCVHTSELHREQQTPSAHANLSDRSTQKGNWLADILARAYHHSWHRTIGTLDAGVPICSDDWSSI